MLKEVVIRSIKDIEPEQSTCGKIFPLSSAEDFEEVNLSIVEINAPTIPHYHKKETEFYLVLKGKGKIITGSETPHEIEEGTLLIIPPDTVHYTIPRTPLTVLVTSSPAWIESDLYIVNDINPEEWRNATGYSWFQEKFELIAEFFSRKELDFKEEMDEEEREKLDTERQSLALKLGLNTMSIPKLRKLLQLS